VQLSLPDDAPFLIFASGRMAGWIAHALEQRASARPIRPRANYVGL
jgi:citrate synthase